MKIYLSPQSECVKFVFEDYLMIPTIGSKEPEPQMQSPMRSFIKGGVLYR